MTLIRQLVLLICVLFFQICAHAGDGFHALKPHPWSFIASLGYGEYESMHQADGLTPIGRLGIAVDVAQFHAFALGLETTIQSGNRMRLVVSQEMLDVFGGLPLEATLKPMLDLLVTAKSDPFTHIPIYAVLKGGIVYRQFQFYRDSINDLSRVTGEVQGGFGYQTSEHTNLSLLYQYVFGGNPNFTINPLNLEGNIVTIPQEQAILLSFSINV